MTIAGVLKDRMKRAAEWGNGRIESSSAITQWRQGDGAPGVRNPGRCDVTGRETEVVDQPSVFCPNSQIGGTYPAYNYRGQITYNVPARACRNCPHRGKKGEASIPYSYCKWAREERGGAQAGQSAYLSLLTKATERATETVQETKLS